MTSTSFTVTEKVDLLFKKLLNKPCTTSSREFFQEPSVTARPYVYQEDIVSYSLPSTAPSDLVGLGDSSTDDNGRPLKGSYAGKTSTVDTNIRYYHKVPMEAVSGSSGASFQAQNATTSHPGGYGDSSGVLSTDYGVSGSYGRVMQGSIPFNQASDGSYGVTVYKSTGTSIPFGSAGGDYLIEPRAGFVTFYEISNVTGVGESTPVLVSFYRYVGTTGGVSNSQVTETVTTTANTFTVQQKFTGGEDNTTGDNAAAIMVDDRDVSSLTTGDLLNAVQWGGNTDGSWRLMVQKSSAGSNFLVQTRVGGSWVSKSMLSNP